jgi:hypothetical protein
MHTHKIFAIIYVINIIELASTFQTKIIKSQKSI